MKLTYRGISYESTPSPTPKLGKTIDTGTYRGAPVVFKALAELPPQPAADLTWRGVPYHTGRADRVPAVAPVSQREIPAVAASPAPESLAVETPSTSIADLARNLFIRRHQRSRRREQGMMVRLAAEVGMSVEDAGHYGSHIQGKMPHDFSGYDRSSTAMS